MSDLVDQMAHSKPTHQRLIMDLLESFRPGTVVTMCQAQDHADELVSRLKRVSQKMLAIELNHFGCVAFDRQIQQSAKDLVPSVAQAPDGAFARALRRIALKMEMV
jgi:flagellar biosynthesis protein FlhG